MVFVESLVSEAILDFQERRVLKVIRVWLENVVNKAVKVTVVHQVLLVDRVLRVCQGWMVSKVFRVRKVYQLRVHQASTAPPARKVKKVPLVRVASSA